MSFFSHKVHLLNKLNISIRRNRLFLDGKSGIFYLQNQCRLFLMEEKNTMLLTIMRSTYSFVV